MSKKYVQFKNKTTDLPVHVVCRDKGANASENVTVDEFLDKFESWAGTTLVVDGNNGIFEFTGHALNNSNLGYTESGKKYALQLDSETNKLYVNVPWDCAITEEEKEEIKTDITELKAKDTELGGKISALETKDTEHESKFLALETECDDLDAAVDELKEASARHDGAITYHWQEIEKLQGDLKTQKEEVQQEITELSSEIAGNLGALDAEINEKINVINATLGNINSSISDLDSRVTVLEGKPQLTTFTIQCPQHCSYYLASKPDVVYSFTTAIATDNLDDQLVATASSGYAFNKLLTLSEQRFELSTYAESKLIELRPLGPGETRLDDLYSLQAPSYNNRYVGEQVLPYTRAVKNETNGCDITCVLTGTFEVTSYGGGIETISLQSSEQTISPEAVPALLAIDSSQIPTGAKLLKLELGYSAEVCGTLVTKTINLELNDSEITQ